MGKCILAAIFGLVAGGLLAVAYCQSQKEDISISECAKNIPLAVKPAEIEPEPSIKTLTDIVETEENENLVDGGYKAHSYNVKMRGFDGLYVNEGKIVSKKKMLIFAGSQ